VVGRRLVLQRSPYGSWPYAPRPFYRTTRKICSVQKRWLPPSNVRLAISRPVCSCVSWHPHIWTLSHWLYSLDSLRARRNICESTTRPSSETLSRPIWVAHQRYLHSRPLPSHDGYSPRQPRKQEWAAPRGAARPSRHHEGLSEISWYRAAPHCPSELA